MAGCAPGRHRWPNILVLIFLSVRDVDNNNAQFGDGEVVQQDPEKDDYWVSEHEKNTKSLVDQFGQIFAGRITI